MDGVIILLVPWHPWSRPARAASRRRAGPLLARHATPSQAWPEAVVEGAGSLFLFPTCEGSGRHSGVRGPAAAGQCRRACLPAEPSTVTKQCQADDVVNMSSGGAARWTRCGPAARPGQSQSVPATLEQHISAAQRVSVVVLALASCLHRPRRLRLRDCYFRAVILYATCCCPTVSDSILQ